MESKVRALLSPRSAPLPILPQRRVRVLNVVSRKGGAGKTTMALLAARHLTEHPDAPLVTVFDLDFSGTSIEDALRGVTPLDAEKAATPFERYLLDQSAGPGWEALAAESLAWYPLPRPRPATEGAAAATEGAEQAAEAPEGTPGGGFYYAASADHAREDEAGAAEALTLSGRRARDLVRARLERLVRWVMERSPKRADFVFVLDNSPGIRGLSYELLADAFAPRDGEATGLPPEISWSNVFVTTPDRQDLIAAFAAWVEEWDLVRERMAAEGTPDAHAAVEAARCLLFLVNKVYPRDDGEPDKLLLEILPPAFKKRSYGIPEIRELLAKEHLRVAWCEHNADLAQLFRGRRAKPVPVLGTYVHGFSAFLDERMTPEKEPRREAPRAAPKGARRRDAYYEVGDYRVDLEAVEDAIAVGLAPAARGFQASLRAELEREGLYRTVALEHPSVEVYQLPRSDSADERLEKLRGGGGGAPKIRFGSRLYRYDPKQPDNVLVLTDRLFVRFEKDKPAAVEARAARYGLRLAERLDGMEEGWLAIVRGGVEESALAIANLLRKDKVAIFAEPDWVQALVQRGRPPRWSEEDQWHFEHRDHHAGTAGADARVFKAWKRGVTGKGVTIAVIDDGVDVDHPQLARKGKLGECLDVRCSTPDPRPKYRQDHGTSAAGVALAARTGGKHRAPAGAAPDARLIAVRMGEIMAHDDYRRAFEHARIHGAGVVSCSWGPADGRSVFVPMPSAVQNEIDQLVKDGRDGKGALVFFAAGNGRESVSTDGWASYKNVIAVAATDHDDKRAKYSNFGPEIWVSAPSAPPNGIITIAPDASHVDDFGGTSSACPLVAGIAALVLQANSALTGADVKEILKATAEKVDPAAPAFVDRFSNTQPAAYVDGHSPAYGWGRVDADRAVKAALDRKSGKSP